MALQWLYGLVALPAITDWAETGRFPSSAREWITEAVAGLVILALVQRVRSEHAAVLNQARRDALTGLWNRRAFEEAIEDECTRAIRFRQPLSLVYLDVDNFKQVNDRYGHQRGDEALQQLATAIRLAARAHVDRGFRIGGDEFVVLLPGGTAGQSEAVVTRIRQHCAQSDPAWADGPLGLSVGIVEFDQRETAAALIRRADAAMYRHKASSHRG
jgi:diguanylate cyclase (GGDEF)-like protein